MESIVVPIHDLARAGSGVARLPDGRIAFVPWTAPGDQVRIRITEESKNYVQAEVTEWIQRSSERIEPRCPAFATCGGCDWQHLPYEVQWNKKTSGVRHALARQNVELAESFFQHFPAEKTWNYRNRIQMRGTIENNNAVLGFYKKGSNQLVPVENCPIADPSINAALPAIQADALKNFKRPFKVEIYTDGQNVQATWNQKHSAAGFEQVHPEQNQKLRKFIAHQLNTSQKNEVLLDLFGGKGNLSQDLWSSFKQTQVVDYGARGKNLETVKFHTGPVLEWLKSQKQNFAASDFNYSVILDPAREGLGHDHSEIFQALPYSKISRLIHVGCDPDAFSRDVSRWVRYGFDIQSVGLFDLFPQTIHIESVAVLAPKRSAG